ncbi:MAG: tRNA pseudouridine(55) synthase TruB, partial [Chloroflexales bacterium]|nr:tRNA pseudouridine(55) synthase TruB [Chloroflexales bacterium]
GVKVGHAGTLDPAADGVLPLALGQATRLIEYLADAPKGYRAVVRLGVATATDDAEGAVLAERLVPALSANDVERALDVFRGPIMQVPPMYSALHHEGKRLYELARAGEHVELAPRPVTIYRLQLVDFALQVEQPKIVLEVECSKGTYIRAIARDLGAALGCGAHLAALTRTFVGALTLEGAVTLAALEADAARLPTLLLPPESAVADWPALHLDEAQMAQVRNGRALRLAAPPADSERLRAHAPDGALLALLRRSGDEWRPDKVFLS